MSQLLWWHRVGQKVVCINDGNKMPDGSYHPRCRVKQGKIYTIRAVFVDDKWNCICFRLEGLVQKTGYWGYEEGYGAHRFRPVRETSIDCFRSLLSPTPDQVRELERETVDG